jgi:hypothetical protein
VADRTARLDIRQPSLDHRREGQLLDDLLESKELSSGCSSITRRSWSLGVDAVLMPRL